MWLGLLYLPSDDDGDDEVVVYAWQRGRDRPLSVAGPLHAVPGMARALRDVGADGSTLPPRCDDCLTPLDLPPL